MAGELILITGGSGFIGIKTIHTALQAGYSVRAAVRYQARADAILATPTVKAINPGSRLSFVTVTDILAENAYEEAVKGVQYVIHGASPVFATTDPNEFNSKIIEPARQGTLSLLKAAHKTPGIKRVVITSSEVAIIPWDAFAINEVDTVFNETWAIPFAPGPYAIQFEAYCASKAAALIATKEFMKANKPEWDVINIMPAFVVGENELITNAAEINSGTNTPVLSQLLGKQSGWGNVASTSVHVADVARLHVEALDEKIKGNQNFLAVSDGAKGTQWDEAFEIVKKNFPEAVKKGLLKGEVETPTKRTKVDASKTEEVFGWKFQPYEEQVKSLVKQYLQLLEHSLS